MGAAKAAGAAGRVPLSTISGHSHLRADLRALPKVVAALDGRSELRMPGPAAAGEGGVRALDRGGVLPLRTTVRSDAGEVKKDSKSAFAPQGNRKRREGIAWKT
jgi:hypothetical protein